MDVSGPDLSTLTFDGDTAAERLDSAATHYDESSTEKRFLEWYFGRA